ncbi:Putative major facilitator superfamily, MFS transporter superfamily [Colletotrichum destructivum]|uniref:Major facilitator superfamily, MFS transporter superfamily n=1 Tax=Colletotrichum destructivum TaxID=34406 RepID=A0AAX4J1E5_9PEZI|nr:Putative major facilitator superfamily, MFS transporter superfamily [Colletotrichum destructivum]
MAVNVADSNAQPGSLAANGASLLTFGKMYAVLSTKKVFLVSIAVSAAGSVVCAVAKTSPVFIVGRVLAGLGCAGMQVGTTLLTASIMPLHKRPFYGGIMGTGETLAVMAGPLVAGGIAQSVGWPWCFWINLPVDAILFVALVLLVTEHRTNAKARRWFMRLEDLGELDLPGGFLIAGGTACLLLGLNSAGTSNSWTDAVVLAPILVSVAVFVVAAVDQHKKMDRATFPTRLLKNRHFVTNLVWLWTQAGSQIPTSYYFPIWIQGLATESVLQASIGILPTLGASIVGTIASGLLAWAVHYLPPGTIAGTAVMAVGSGLLYSLRPDSSRPVWMGFGAVFGLGNGFTTQQVAVGAQAELDEKDFPAGMSALAVVRNVSAAIFIAVNHSVFMDRLSRLSSVMPGFSPASATNINRSYLESRVSPENFSRALDIFNDALTRMFLVSMGLGIAGFLIAFFLPWTSLKKPEAGTDASDELDLVEPVGRQPPWKLDHDTGPCQIHYRHTISLERGNREGISQDGSEKWESKTPEHLRQRCVSL